MCYGENHYHNTPQLHTMLVCMYIENMNKKQKIDYIESIINRFENASNHGNQGNNWWYPKPCVFAYNVKMRNFGYIESLRKHLSALQNDFYSDEELQERIYEEQNDSCYFLVEVIKVEFGLESWFAGRVGGWVEVDFTPETGWFSQEDWSTYTLKEINVVYKQAKELEKLADKVQNFITERHKSYNEYVDSKSYYQDLQSSFLSDEDIKEIYQNRIAKLQAKLVS